MSNVLTTEPPNQPPLDWSGHMAVSARQATPVQPATQYVFGPLIDSPPAHPDTVLTTLVHAEQFLREQGTNITHIVADMQLYKVALQIKWSDHERWKDLVLRPGGMHMLMSFIGCIGVLMRGTGLEDLLGCAFAGVPNTMNGKAWPKALRALRMVTTALLDEVHYRGITVVDLQAELEKADSCLQADYGWIAW